MAIPSLIVISTALVYLAFDSKEFVWAVIAGVIVAIFFFTMAFFRFYFITFYAGPDKVRLRFKSLSPFPTQNNSIQIPSEKFHDYTMTRSFLGKKKGLVFFMKTQGGVAAYPKTSISALSENEITQITKALDLIKQINKTTHSGGQEQ